jgi:hypothetical protein
MSRAAHLDAYEDMRLADAHHIADAGPAALVQRPESDA